MASAIVPKETKPIHGTSLPAIVLLASEIHKHPPPRLSGD